MNTLIFETEKVEVRHHIGISKFKGCQCFKDCSCNEDYKPSEYNFYTVKKKFNKIKTTNHATKEDAMVRVDFLNNLQQ